jgi:hypothetical protein
VAWRGESDCRLAFETTKATDYTRDEAFSNTHRTNALKQIFTGGYWDRLWVVQEKFHARRIIVQCGSLEINWEILMREALAQPLWKIQMEETHRLHLELCGYYDASLALNFLNVHGNLECMDPRDTVYALRSLAPCLEKVSPDYTKSTASVFTAAARAIIRGSGNLKVLEFASKATPPAWSLTEEENLPSWVPDWKVFNFGPTHFHKNKIWNPDAGRPEFVKKPHVILSHENNRVLRLRGTSVDIILESRQRFTPVSYITKQCNQVKAFISWLPSCDVHSIIRHLKGDRYRTLINLGTLLSEYVRQLGIEAPTGNTQSMLDDFEVFELAGYSAVITKTGYKGLIIGEPKVGDLLFVAYGSRYPYILRQEEEMEGAYSLVGCAVIDGLMNGEALDLQEAGKLTERTVLLV